MVEDVIRADQGHRQAVEAARRTLSGALATPDADRTLAIDDFRAARRTADQARDRSRTALRELLTIDQEAALISAGVLE